MKIINTNKVFLEMTYYWIICLATLVALSSPLKGQVWSKTFGGNESELAHDVLASNEGGSYAFGTTYSYDNSDFYLIKVDSLGNLIWSQTYGTAQDDVGYALAISKTGDLFLTGTTGINNKGSLVIKVDSQGAVIWNKGINTGSGTELREVIATSDNGCFLVGSNTNPSSNFQLEVILFKLDSLGNIEWSKHHDIYPDGSFATSALEMDNCFLVGGDIISSTSSNNLSFLASFDKSGNLLWKRAIGSGGAIGLVQVDTNTVVFANRKGPFSIDAQLHKIKSDSILIWTKSLISGMGANNYFTDIEITNDGGMVLVGEIKPFSYQFPIAYIAKVDSLSNLIYTRQYGGYGRQGKHLAYGVSQSKVDDSYFVCGSSINYNLPTIHSDLLLMKVGEQGFIGLDKLEAKERELIRTTDFMGIEVKHDVMFKPLLRYYSDGTVEKVFIIPN